MKVEWILEVSDIFGVVLSWARDSEDEAESLKKVITYNMLDAAHISIRVYQRAKIYKDEDLEIVMEGD